MRRRLLNSLGRKKEDDERNSSGNLFDENDLFEAANRSKIGDHAARPDQDGLTSENGHRYLVEEGQAAIRDPEAWAKEKRTSISKKKSVGGRMDGNKAKNGKETGSNSKRTSRASFDDIFEQASIEQVESILNPDAIVQIDADSDDYDEFDLPKAGTTIPPKTKKKNKKTTAPKSRLSARLSNLVSSSRSNLGKKSPAAPPAAPPQKQSVSKNTDAVPLKTKSKKTTSILRSSAQRLSFRRDTPEKAAARAEKQRIKEERKAEAKRLKEVAKDPWYPAGVDFRSLGPKSQWLPFLGRKDPELDFGNESRLIGVVS